MSVMSVLDMLCQTHCCPQCNEAALERESKLADQCLILQDIIQHHAELIDELRAESKEKSDLINKYMVMVRDYKCLVRQC